MSDPERRPQITSWTMPDGQEVSVTPITPTEPMPHRLHPAIDITLDLIAIPGAMGAGLVLLSEAVGKASQLIELQEIKDPDPIGSTIKLVVAGAVAVWSARRITRDIE